jgi:WD40 repeat protein
VAGEDKTIRIWDGDAGNELFLKKGHMAPVVSLVFSQDGKLLALGSEGRTAKLWDVNKGPVCTTLTRHTEQVNSVAFADGGDRC